MRKLVFVVSVALLAGAAQAQDACRADAEKLCAGIPQGGGRVFACLRAHQEKLSPPCKQRIGAISKKLTEVGRACGDDVAQFCPDTQAGGGRLLRCLEANAAKISEPCQRTLALVEERTAAFKKACGPDAGKFCEGVPKGKGRILACLKSRQADLAPACQKLMEPVFAMPAAVPAVPPQPAGAPAAAPIPAAAPALAPAAPPAMPAPPAKP